MEILEYLYGVQRHTHLARLQEFWNSLSSEVQHQSILDLYAICRSLGLDPQDFQLKVLAEATGESYEAMPEMTPERLSEHTSGKDPEFHVSDFFLCIIERQINESNVFLQTPFTVVERAVYQLIEHFRALSLSAVDTTGEPTQRGRSRGFFSYVEEKPGAESRYRAIMHRLPYTVSACICENPSSIEEGSGEGSGEGASSTYKVYLGRSASRTVSYTHLRAHET